MQGVEEKKPDDQFVLFELTRKLPECGLVLAGGESVRELPPELSRQILFEAQGTSVVQALGVRTSTEPFAQFRFRQLLHPDQQAAAVSRRALPCLHVVGQVFPATQVEVTHAEVGTEGGGEGRPQGNDELFIDVVEDAGHAGSDPPWRPPP